MNGWFSKLHFFWYRYGASDFLKSKNKQSSQAHAWSNHLAAFILRAMFNLAIFSCSFV